jgi:hypothetical protein
MGHGTRCFFCEVLPFLWLTLCFEGMEKTPGSKKALNNDAFLAELQTALGKAAEKGSAFVTMKQVKEGSEVACLVRCRYQDHKSNTVVRGKDLVRFQTRLAAVLKSTWSSALPKKPSKVFLFCS